MSTHVKGKVRIYACGGCGLNNGQHFEQFRGANDVGFAQLDIVYVDTSKSNLRASINPEHCYMLEGLDGSGKIRKENHAEISAQIKAIMQKFKPVDLNIVISSAAGGSGSVIAPLLTSELIANEHPTVVISIGSADTRLDCENTLKTIKSYEAISQMRKTAIAMAYIQNSQTTSRTNADEEARQMIMALCVLFSRENQELDSKDLFNFLRFERVTTFQPSLVMLQRVEGSNDISVVDTSITVATLAKENTNTTLGSVPEYQCVGYVPADIDPMVMAKLPMHFVTADGVFTDVTKGLQSVLSNLDAIADARVKRGSILGSNDKTEGTGLVL